MLKAAFGAEGERCTGRHNATEKATVTEWMARRVATSRLRQDTGSCSEGRSPAADKRIVVFQDQGSFPGRHLCTVSRSVARADRPVVLSTCRRVSTAVVQGMQTVDRGERVVRLSSGSQRNFAKHDSNSNFRFLWPCIVSKVWREKNQQDATIRCLLLTSVSTCIGHHYAHLQENKGPVTAFGVYWSVTSGKT